MGWMKYERGQKQRIDQGTKIRRETYEIYADGGNVTLSVSIIGETKQETRLSNSGITDQQQLEQIVTV